MSEKYYVDNLEFEQEDGENVQLDLKDAEAVNQDGGELNNTIVTYDDNTTSVSSWPDFIDQFVSGTKIGKFFKNLYAGAQFLLHVGSIVNNCVTDNSELPLSAAQGKALNDLITDANTAIDGKAPTSHASSSTTYGVGNASNYGHVKLTDTYTSNGGAASSSIAASGQAVYNVYNTLNSKFTDGSVTKLGTSTYGSTSRPIYWNAGVPAALSSTVGSSTTPIYSNSGTLTALSSVGSWSSCTMTATSSSSYASNFASNAYCYYNSMLKVAVLILNEFQMTSCTVTGWYTIGTFSGCTSRYTHYDMLVNTGTPTCRACNISSSNFSVYVYSGETGYRYYRTIMFPIS